MNREQMQKNLVALLREYGREGLNNLLTALNRAWEETAEECNLFDKATLEYPGFFLGSTRYKGESVPTAFTFKFQVFEGPVEFMLPLGPEGITSVEVIEEDNGEEPELG